MEPELLKKIFEGEDTSKKYSSVQFCYSRLPPLFIVDANPEIDSGTSDVSAQSEAGSIGYSRNRLDSFSSVTSIYSADGGQGDYRITGRVEVGVWHKNDTLFVRLRVWLELRVEVCLIPM